MPSTSGLAARHLLRELRRYRDEWTRLRSPMAMLAFRQCTSVGRGPVQYGRAHIENYGRLEIGHNFRLSSTPVQSHLVVGPRGSLVFGDDVAIGTGAAIAAHAEIRIGNETQIGPYVMIMDTDFHGGSTADGQIPPGQPIVIGDGVQIGTRVTILKGSNIQGGARIRAGSVVSGMIVAGAWVGGVPARTLSSAAARSEVSPLAGAQSALERVRKVVAATFGLAELPTPVQGPDEIVGWDSLGTLKLVLALEDEFASTLSDADLVGVANLYDLTAAVERSGRSADRALAQSDGTERRALGWRD